ncbi:cytochrome c oxidase assembly protein [Nocardioides soli]|uniref:Putative copper resistance protein D n=1 Tax=Nocardioides soli TaxID=1036020 RepID=A0A7W4Z2E2_9ACTN|nr:putative copper resistance protein D [Nocardioides soli]
MTAPSVLSGRRTALGGIVVLGLGALVVLLLLGGGAPRPEPAGLPDPGPWTGWGLPVLTYLGLLLGIAVVGALLVPPLTMPGGGELGGRAFRAVRTVGPLALAWFLVTVGVLVLTYSDQFAVPVRHVRPEEVWGFARGVDQGRALLVQAALALVIAAASRFALTAREVGVLLVLAVATLMPPVFTGHSAAAGSHDTAVVSLLLHVGAAGVWVGGVVALWWHLGSAPALRAVAARRFARVATWCLGVTAVSGVVNALVRLGGPTGFVTSDYGRGALVKVLLLGVVALVAFFSREVALGRLAQDGRGWRDLTVLTGIEVGVLAVATALGVGLGRTPPPVGEIYTSLAESLLGGPVPPALTPYRLLTELTPSGIGLAILGLGGTAYAVGVLSLRRQGVRWGAGRTVSWYLGLALVGYATIGGLGTYSHAMFSAHMAAHMVLSMIAPILLVLGAPVTLALRTLPGADAPGGRGPRHWLSGVLRSRPVRVLTHPVVAAILFVGSLYAIYFSTLFEALMRNHLGHAFMELHFLLVGCLYFEVLVGNAPVPRRPSHFARLGLLLVVMPFHSFFAIAVMNESTVIGGGYYRLLDRPYATDLLQDQYVGGSLTWALGEVPMVLLLMTLVIQWYRSDAREAVRHDRRADRDDDAELVAYNRMLGGLAAHDDELRTVDRGAVDRGAGGAGRR